MTTLTIPRHRATHRTIAEVMTQTVTTVEPEATYKEVINLLRAHRISGLPVVDAEGALVGVVSEADLLAKERQADEPFLGSLRKSWREEHARADAVLVRDLMTSPAVTVSYRAALPVAARAMARRNVRRLCVVDDAGHLIGLVTRGDLLRPFARDDAELAEDIRLGVLLETMWLDPVNFTVSVVDGVAHISGSTERRSEVDILHGLVRHVDGIVGVDLDLTWNFDDTHQKDHQLPPRV